jgi:hypothetical protein
MNRRFQKYWNSTSKNRPRNHGGTGGPADVETIAYRAWQAGRRIGQREHHNYCDTYKFKIGAE